MVSKLVYNLRNNQIPDHLECLNCLIEGYNTSCENITFIGNFTTVVKKILQCKLSRMPDTKANRLQNSLSVN